MIYCSTFKKIIYKREVSILSSSMLRGCWRVREIAFANRTIRSHRFVVRRDRLMQGILRCMRKWGKLSQLSFKSKRCPAQACDIHDRPFQIIDGELFRFGGELCNFESRRDRENDRDTIGEWANQPVASKNSNESCRTQRNAARQLKILLLAHEVNGPFNGLFNANRQPSR